MQRLKYSQALSHSCFPFSFFKAKLYISTNLSEINLKFL